MAVDLYLRSLGLIYLLAIASLWPQIHGLVGSEGILPVRDVVAAVHEQFGAGGWTRFPSILLINPGDVALHVLCAAGVLVSLGLILGYMPLACTVILWLLYLSLTTGGQVFLGFQWDNLLLEAGFLSIWIAPPVLRMDRHRRPQPSRLFLFLLYGLVFRLMFASGWVKLASGDPSWRNLTALDYHYWTQPITVWTAWWVHKLPLGFHKVSCAVMFVIELVVPFLAFGPKACRRAAAALLVFLQVIIFATGNYGYFNLLSIVLCIPLVDDGVWQRLRRVTDTQDEEMPRSPSSRRLLLCRFPVFLFLLVMSLTVFGGQVARRPVMPETLRQVYGAIAPFRTINGYGLFASMTKSRPEIEIQGSPDGIEWRTYTFRYKAGDPKRMPGFVAPHMPRLDWQMWFAALGDIRGNRWMIQFMARLLEGSEPVEHLLASNPFSDTPPKLMRAVRYEYRFSTIAEWRETGAWWVREEAGMYCPPVGLRSE